MKKIQLVNKEKLGRPGITYQDVSKAIIELQKAKVEPTLRSIKKLLGHGGVTTISQYRAKYFIDNPSKSNKSKDYLNGWRDAMKQIKVYIQDNMK